MNYFALEPVLLKHLASQCPSIHAVEGLPKVWSLMAEAQRVNELNANGRGGAAFVIFWGEDVTQARRDCDRANQTWLIGVVSKNQTRMAESKEARRDNGKLVDEVLKALRGWDYGTALGTVLGQTMHKRYLKRVSCPVNHHQLEHTENGVTITLLAYVAEDLIVGAHPTTQTPNP
jgi:hypothetical protein